MRSKFRGSGIVASATVLVLVTAGAWFGYRQLAGPSCSGQVRLTVAAAPEIAPAVRASSQRWIAAGAAADGFCVTVEVTASEPVDVATSVAAAYGVALTGVDQDAGATAAVPEVWIPDSAVWLARLREQASGFAPGNGASIARSPVVLAVPEPVAATLGWPDRKVSWRDLLQRATTGSRMRTGIVEPPRDATGLAGLLAMVSAARTVGASAPQTTTSALRALAGGRSTHRAELIAKFPQSADPASITAGLSAAVLPERDVVAYNDGQPAVPLAAIYPDPAPMALDYPYAVLPGTDPVKTRAAEAFFAVLRTGAFTAELGAAGLRAADGTGAAGFRPPRGAPTTAAAAPAGQAGGNAIGGVEPAAVEQILSSWLAATLSGRMLAVIDVSGSMLDRVPTARNATRAQVTREAAQRGLALFDDSWRLGLWTFSTNLVGDRDYRELVPVGPLSKQRGQIERALNEIVPKKTGDTGLYDTMLAAYRQVQEGWESGRVNSVVMFTDGRNDDARGISQQGLLRELKRLADPERPIQVVIIGIGNEVSRAELESITKVTGGGVFITEDPAKIGQIFLQAISLRPPANR